MISAPCAASGARDRASDASSREAMTTLSSMARFLSGLQGFFRREPGSFVVADLHEETGEDDREPPSAQGERTPQRRFRLRVAPQRLQNARAVQERIDVVRFGGRNRIDRDERRAMLAALVQQERAQVGRASEDLRIGARSDPIEGSQRLILTTERSRRERGGMEQ